MKKLFNHKLLSLLFAAVLSLMNLTAQAQDGMASITLSPELEQREHQLAKNLRCLVCQNQSIADSGAGLADDLKAEIRLQLSLGKSDEEIVQHMVERYGEFINYNPAFNSTTFLLWVGPALVLGLMLVLLIRTIRQQGKGLNMRDSESAE
ncbi:cytochrome c-type biogenesis protein CcmH [Oligella urethralis]|uniref:cytochrome c-type biogenesis protein n=1 Tax=Oligella urethralis TaxID=90245 RepID=UPI000CFF9C62|nr:cytochrome c-type biogenesis protein [Oligella urethralis]AVL71346.1 cytochrome c-type biogenesis protein CcmH [Oligella urethralis]